MDDLIEDAMGMAADGGGDGGDGMDDDFGEPDEVRARLRFPGCRSDSHGYGTAAR